MTTAPSGSPDHRPEINGYDVTACADGVEALAAFRTSRPDVLVLDVMMPGVDGLGCVESCVPRATACRS